MSGLFAWARTTSRRTSSPAASILGRRIRRASNSERRSVRRADHRRSGRANDSDDLMSRRDTLIAFVCAAACFLWSAANATAESLWYDELFTVWVARRPWGDVMAQTAADGFTPPLFYALVKL